MKISGEKLSTYIASTDPASVDVAAMIKKYEQKLQGADQRQLLDAICAIARDFSRMVCPRCDQTSRDLSYYYVLRQYCGENEIEKP